MKTLYFECFSGISGDMTVSSLLDLGADRELLLRQLSSLPLDGYRIELGRRLKNGISAASFDVILEPPDAVCGGDHAHARGLPEIERILDAGDLSDAARALAKKMFRALAEAEGEVHGKPPEQVHFHEVGAVDSILDIAAASILFTRLSPDRVVFSTIREGSGFVRCQHGLIPVPAPATLKLLQKCGADVEFTEVRGEMVTPTGAVVVATLADRTGAPCPSGRVLASGCGCGKKDFEHPNILRTFLVESDEEAADGRVCVLTAAVDDMTGEQLGYAMEKLFQAGCADAYYTPIQMKKNRPGVELTVLCRPELEAEIVRVLFAHTTTIGMRRALSERHVMDRESRSVHTDYGEVGVKICRFQGIEKVSVEYEDARRAALAADVPIRAVYESAISNFSQAAKS